MTLRDARAPNLQDRLTIIVLGRSGSGKGTQAKFIINRLRREGVYHVETGRFFRKIITKNIPSASLARMYMKRGYLLPLWFAAYLWLKELIEKGHVASHLVYDGAPRRVHEAELIDEVAFWHGKSLPLCVYIDTSEKEATRRLLLRRRRDDRVSAIKNRMKFFRRDVLPVARYYEKRGRLIRIDGNPSPEIVSQLVERALLKRLKSKWPVS